MTKYSLPAPLPLRNPYSPYRNFNFIRPIQIKGSNKDLKNYQVKIVLNKNNFPLEKCKSDGSDIRFKDETGQALSYWIQSWTSDEAIIWCKIPSIPANRTKEIWIIYGNPSASSESNGDATFEFFDDFYPVQSKVDYFASNGIHAPWMAHITPAATYHNSKTFIVWQGSNLDPYAIEYDHSTKTWSSIYQVGTNPLGSDAHGSPSLLRDSSGYLHVFYGCHGTSTCSGDNCYIQHAKSTNTDDVSSWTDKGNIGPTYATYPKPVLINSDIYIFFRRWTTGTDHFVEAYIKSTDGGESWGSYNDIIDFGGGAAIYSGVAEAEGTSKIHISWCYHDYDVGTRLHAYHAYLDLSDMHMYSMDGTDLGTTISKTEADAHCRAFDSGTSGTNIVRVHVDSSGTPYIIFLHNDGGWKYKFTKWNGSSWDTPVTITSTDDVNSFDFIVHSSSNIELYLTSSGSAGKGGDIEKWAWDGSSWSKVTTVMSESDTNYPLSYPSIVFGYNSELKVIFSEVHSDYSTPLRVFAYGDNGIVQKVTGEGIDTNKWNVDGNVVVSNSEIALDEDDGIYSKPSWGYGYSVISKAKADEQDVIFVSFRISGGAAPQNAIDTLNSDYHYPDDFDRYNCRSTVTSGENHYVDNQLDFRNVYRLYEITRLEGESKYYQDGNLMYTRTSNLPTVDLGVGVAVWDSSQPSTLTLDWILVRKYHVPEPVVII